MLQQLGLIKYNKKYLLENGLNTNPFFSPKINNYIANLRYQQNNLKFKSCNQKKKNPKFNDINSPKKEEFTEKIDRLLSQNINMFISESTHKVQNNNNNKNNRLSLIQINHDIDDNIYGGNKLSVSFTPKKMSKSAAKIKNQINNIKNEYLTEKIENQQNNDNQFNIEKEIIYKNEIIKQLIINNNSIQAKINLLKDQFNNNIKNSTETNKLFKKELYNSQNLKKNKEIIDNDISSLKENIIELKNKLSLLNRKQTSINLLLFKEEMENELKKEDVNKMKKLIENINQDIKKRKKEIGLIQHKNKKLRNSHINLSFKKKK